MRRPLVIAAIVTVLSGSLAYTNTGAVAPAYSPVAQPAQSTPVNTADPVPSVYPAPSTSPSPTPTRQPQTVAVSSRKISGNNLSINAIGFQAPIVTVGVTPDNAIDVPSGQQVGWWNGSATPGQPGAVFLDGHVGGVFARLPSARPGQIVSVNYGGQTYTYEIVHTEVVALEGIDMDRALSVYGGASEGLNMMTCAGKYISSQGTYDHRLVVYAIRI